MKNIDKKPGIKYIDIYRKSDHEIVVTLLYSKESERFAEHISKQFDFYYKCIKYYKVDVKFSDSINEVRQRISEYIDLFNVNNRSDNKNLFEWLNRHFGFMKEYTTECLINGKKLEYDACDSRDLKIAKEQYKDWKYLGSSNVYFINGVRNESNNISHYFKRS